MINLPTWFQSYFVFVLGYQAYTEYEFVIPREAHDLWRARLKAWERCECTRKAVEHD